VQLGEIIINKLHEQNCLSFHDYMEMCLYYPELGYYTSTKNKIGPQGDYYTSSSVGAAFGTMIAEQITEMWHLLGKGIFTVVEYGAGTGYLCHDILDHLNANKQLYDNLNYCIIEKSPAMRAKEKEHLCDKVTWLNNIGEIKGFTGCVLSNELVDNLAVHRVSMDEELMEIFVYHDGKEFKEVMHPASEELKKYFNTLQVELPQGYKTEINLEATTWIKEIAEAMHKGYVLTIDYGYPSTELYRPYRKDGTMVCYNKHKMNTNPYIDIGIQDITTHVNFTALYQWGLMHGLNGSGFIDQAHFLLGLGLDSYLRKQETDAQKLRESLFIQNKLLGDMGDKFKVLIQEKGTAGKTLRGLKYAWAA